MLDLANTITLLLAAVAAVAMYHGRNSAALASVLPVVSLGLFFVSLRFPFTVSDIQYLLTSGVMSTVSMLVGQLTVGLREQARIAV